MFKSFNGIHARAVGCSCFKWKWKFVRILLTTYPAAIHLLRRILCVFTSISQRKKCACKCVSLSVFFHVNSSTKTNIILFHWISFVHRLPNSDQNKTNLTRTNQTRKKKERREQKKRLMKFVCFEMYEMWLINVLINWLIQVNCIVDGHTIHHFSLVISVTKNEFHSLSIDFIRRSHNMINIDGISREMARKRLLVGRRSIKHFPIQLQEKKNVTKSMRDKHFHEWKYSFLTHSLSFARSLARNKSTTPNFTQCKNVHVCNPNNN